MSNDLFNTVGTFMGVPQSRDLGDAKAAIVGVPFDCGVHPRRIGSRLGPASIREQSGLVRFDSVENRTLARVAAEPEDPDAIPGGRDYNPLTRLGLVDCGDVRLVPGRPEQALPAIEAAVGHVVDRGAIPVTMGGDGVVTLPQLRALHARHPDLVVLHFDAHTDTYPDEEGQEPINTGSTFTRAAEEGVVDTANSFHIGCRGSSQSTRVFAHTRGKGYNLIDGEEFRTRGAEAVLAEVRERLAGRPVYLCFDMDFFDPSCAPGVCTPTWGGVSAREGIGILRSLSGLNFVAFDVNTVSPPHDVGGMTAFLAATVMHECLFLACRAIGLDNVGAAGG